MLTKDISNIYKFDLSYVGIEEGSHGKHIRVNFIQQRRSQRRERLLRGRLNPLEKYDEVEIKMLFRFERVNIL